MIDNDVEINTISTNPGDFLSHAVKRVQEHLEFELGKSDLTERLRAIIGLFKNQSVMAEQLGMSVSGIKGWLRGVEPGFLKIRLLTEITGVSYQWLATGKVFVATDYEVELLRLKLHRNAQPSPSHSSDTKAIQMVFGEIQKEIEGKRDACGSDATQYESAVDASVQIPRYDVHLSAGGGHWNDDNVSLIDYIPFTHEFLKKKLDRETTHDLLILEAAGDSMWPTISDGDLVLVDKRAKMRADGIFAYVQDGLARVKRFRFMASGKVEIVSDNRDIYSPEVLSNADMEEINIVGRVKWIGHTV